MEFNDKSVNDLTQQYFTDLSKNKSLTFTDKGENKMNQSTKRFTFTENIFINKSPKSLSESCGRYGEYFYKL